jgi:hypothetical protein
MTENMSRRESLRPCSTPRARQGQGADATILYTVGSSIPRSDCKDLDIVLDQFHANEELQAMCRSVATNTECYMTLENANGLGQRYKAKTLIPTGTVLAVYSGSLERVQTPAQGACKWSTTAVSQATPLYARNGPVMSLV